MWRYRRHAVADGLDRLPRRLAGRAHAAARVPGKCARLRRHHGGPEAAAAKASPSTRTSARSSISCARPCSVGRSSSGSPAKPISTCPPSRREKKELIDKLRERCRSTSGRFARPAGDSKRDQSSLYTITVDGSERQKRSGRAVAGQLVRRGHAGRQAHRLRFRAAFPAPQIAEYDQRLAEAEGQLADFKKNNIGLVPGAPGDYFSRLQAETEPRSARRLCAWPPAPCRTGAPDEWRVATPIGGAAARCPVRPRWPRRCTSSSAARPRALDELLLSFTDKHPDVVAARETLEELKARSRPRSMALQSGEASAETWPAWARTRSTSRSSCS